ncbi:MAG: leucine-rich repeat protein [Oscillospiraceae bacterium]|nr:leucine-rich repeat protein [Oscillospiraceae bacterium]
MKHAKKGIALMLFLALLFGLLPTGAFPVAAAEETGSIQIQSEQTEPEQTESVQTEPEQTESVQTEPEQTEPVQTEPEQTEPVQTEPEQTEPVWIEPEQTEPAQTEPEQTETAEMQPEQLNSVEDAPIAITEGIAFSAVIEEAGDYVWFSFIPDDTCAFMIRGEATFDLNIAVYDSSENLVSGGDISAGNVYLPVVLNGSQEYRICVNFADAAQTGTVTVSADRKWDIHTTESFSSSISVDTAPECVAYVAETSDYYAFSVETSAEITVSLFDENNQCMRTVSGSGIVYIGETLTAGNTYMLVAATDTEEDSSIEIGLIRYRELAESVWTDTDVAWYGDEAGFIFTPKTSGVYAFKGSAEESTKATLQDLNGTELASGYLSFADSGPYFFCTMTAGESYLLVADFRFTSDSGIISVMMEKIPEVVDDSGEAVIGEFGDTALFVYTPAFTDRYLISWDSDYPFNIDISLENGEDLGYEYISSTESVYILNADTTYILRIRLTDYYSMGKVLFNIRAAHAYENAEEVLPTCTEEGLRTYTCKYCQELIQEVIPMTHEYDNGACVRCGDPYIVEMNVGFNVYEPEFADWQISKAYYSFTPSNNESYTFESNAGGDTVGYLYDCNGNLLTSNDDDDEGNPDFVITYTLEAGKTYYLVSEKYFAESDENLNVFLVVNHDFTTVVEPATCTEDGAETSICKICGYKKTRILNADHVWDEGVVVEESSCDVAGTIAYTCTVCGETETETEGGYGHSYYDDIYCYNCGKLLEDEGSCGSDLFWRIDSTQTLTISGSGAMADYQSYGDSAPPWNDYMQTIHKVIIEEGVTSVGAYAFYYFETVNEVSLPETLCSIEGYAFYGCGAENFYIPAAVTYIAPNAFCNYGSGVVLNIAESNAHYSADENALYNKEKTVLYDLVSHISGVYRIPECVTTIAENALSGNISYLIIPGSVSRIENNSLADSLNYDAIIRFEGDAPSFGDSAFDGKYGSFDGRAYYPADNETWTEAVMQDYGGYPQWTPILELFASGTCGSNLEWTLDSEATLTITGTGPMDDFGTIMTEDYEQIYNECPWEEYKNLIRKVILPQGITRIGQSAFEYCTAMQVINIPDTVTQIGSAAFQSCSSLTEIELPDSVQQLEGYGIFLDCVSLIRARLPEGITTIPDTMFGRCSALKEVNIPDSVTKIESAAFSSCYSLENVTLPDTITVIDYWAFQHCIRLKEINIPSSLIMIGGKAFRDCPNLTEIQLPEGLRSIAGGAFYDCTGLTQIVVPSTVEKIGWGAFAGCNGLKEMVIPEGIDYLGGTFWNCTGLETVTIPDSVTNIAYWAFRNCRSLKTVKLPEKLEYIGDGIFTNSGVDSITFPGDAPEFAIPNTVTDSTYNAFLNSTALAELDAPESLQSLTEDGTSTFAVTYPYSDAHVGTFGDITATAYYPGDNATWTEEVLAGDYGGNITWKPIAEKVIPGDLNGDNTVNDSDVEQLLWYTLFPEMNPINTEADFDGNGIVDDGDVEYLLWYTLFPELFPLY